MWIQSRLEVVSVGFAVGPHFTAGNHSRKSFSLKKPNSSPAPPPPSYFEKLVFVCILEWTCCAMQCILRQGMGRDALARERSQALLVEGSSHVALLKVKFLWGGLYWRLKACLSSGCVLSFDQLVALIWWAFEWFSEDSPPAEPSSALYASRFLLEMTAGQSLAGCWRLVSQGCDLHISVNKEYICAWGIQQEEPERQPCCSASIHVSPPLEPLSCLAERPGKMLRLWNSGILARQYFASSSSYSRDCAVSVSVNLGTRFQRPY